MRSISYDICQGIVPVGQGGEGYGAGYGAGVRVDILPSVGDVSGTFVGGSDVGSGEAAVGGGMYGTVEMAGG